jgi:hypothetical protein
MNYDTSINANVYGNISKTANEFIVSYLFRSVTYLTALSGFKNLFYKY